MSGGGHLARELRGIWRSLQYDVERTASGIRNSRLRRVPGVGGVLLLIVVIGAGVTAAAFQLRPDMPLPRESTLTVMPPMAAPTATSFVTVTPAPSLVPTVVPTTIMATSYSTRVLPGRSIYLVGPTHTQTRVATRVRTHSGPTVTATQTVPGPTIYVTETATPSSDPTGTATGGNPSGGGTGTP